MSRRTVAGTKAGYSILIGRMEVRKVVPIETGRVGSCLSNVEAWEVVHDCWHGESEGHLQSGLATQQHDMPSIGVAAAQGTDGS